MDASKLTICGCLGPMYGEPHCYCTMKRLNLPLNESARAEEQKRSEAQLKTLFSPGGLFDPNRNINPTEKPDVQ